MHSVIPNSPHFDAQYMAPPAKAFLPANDAMLMMCPVRRSIIPFATALLSRNTDFKLVSNTESQFASFASWKGPKYPMPALFTKISIAPNACFVFCTSDSISPGRVTSAAVKKIAAPVLLNSSATLSSLSTCRAHKLSFAPILPSLRATANPIPRLAPVIKATFPSKIFPFVTGKLHRGDYLPTWNIITLGRCRSGNHQIEHQSGIHLARVNGFPYNSLIRYPVFSVRVAGLVGFFRSNSGQEAVKIMRKFLGIIGALGILIALSLSAQPAAAQDQ